MQVSVVISFLSSRPSILDSQSEAFSPQSVIGIFLKHTRVYMRMERK